jgi:hypothetical protein
VVDEVVAVGREVGLDDGVDGVVVAGVHDGVAEDDESRRQGLIFPFIPRMLMLAGIGMASMMFLPCGSRCTSSSPIGETKDEQEEEQQHGHPGCHNAGGNLDQFSNVECGVRGVVRFRKIEKEGISTIPPWMGWIYYTPVE